MEFFGQHYCHLQHWHSVGKGSPLKCKGWFGWTLPLLPPPRRFPPAPSASCEGPHSVSLLVLLHVALGEFLYLCGHLLPPLSGVQGGCLR